MLSLHLLQICLVYVNTLMIQRVLSEKSWGLQPKIVTGDSWYSSRDNLKFLKNQELGFLMGIAKNRTVSILAGEYTQIQNLEIPDEGRFGASEKVWARESISDSFH